MAASDVLEPRMPDCSVTHARRLRVLVAVILGLLATGGSSLDAGRWAPLRTDSVVPVAEAARAILEAPDAWPALISPDGTMVIYGVAARVRRWLKTRELFLQRLSASAEPVGALVLLTRSDPKDRGGYGGPVWCRDSACVT
jgi:hypothetical protein